MSTVATPDKSGNAPDTSAHGRTEAGRSAAPPARKKSGTGRITLGWWVLTVLIGIWCLFPVFSILATSFKTPSDLSNGRLLPTSWSTVNYEEIFVGGSRELFLTALRNSVGISVIATVVAVVLATLCAYAIARLDFPGKRLVLTVSLMVSMFPVISLVTPLFNVWRTIGLYDTWLGLIIPYLSLTLPISIWTLAAFFKQIPWELDQAAQVDGATPLQAFRKVIVPLAAPGVFTTAIIAFFIAWNDFVYGISLTSTEAARPVPAALAFFTGASQFESPTGAISAAAIIVTIPIVLLVLFFQKQIVAGLTNGAVKG
ncbi:Binding-protein-dependent transport systems inner membrane component [Micrococcus lylae]|uniref:Binding-protein-dependent transport systems inner membrane component n=1 Tax=Micrococcus lylae TaxID=1273 RepID=A0A1R4JRD7_9MICC|nr:Binding-protein-dependent transport systems inner membrane component [Micrococcus lylae]